jgi:hypothetical protein
MFKNFNIQAFCLKLLPPILRKDRIRAFLRVLLSPLESILARFRNVVVDTDVRLSHNSFTIYLEKFLNDLLDATERRIYIADIIDDFSVHLSMKDEAAIYEDSMTLKAEDLDTLIVPSEKPDRLTGRFGVYIPKELDSEINRRLIKQWVDYYKMAGTNYSIETYG